MARFGTYSGNERLENKHDINGRKGIGFYFGSAMENNLQALV